MAAAQAVRTVTPTGTAVIVACKLPQGLHAECRDNAGETVRVTFRGSAAERRLQMADDKGRMMDHPTIREVKGGYGLTKVDKAFWDQWSKENATAPFMKAGLIFAAPNYDRTAGRAREQAEISNGLEPIDPLNADKRRGRIATDERHGADASSSVNAREELDFETA